MSKNIRAAFVLKGIPFGFFAVEEFIQTDFAQDAIKTLKAQGDDPALHLMPFLVFYQFADIKAQLLAIGKHEAPATPEGDEKLLDLAVKNLAHNFDEIMAGIGEEGLCLILSALSNEKTVH